MFVLLCGELDQKVYPMSEYAVGTTAPPFHPWCRCTTAPYFEDMEGIGERSAKDEDGNTYNVPKDMTYDEWKEKFVDNKENSGIIKPNKIIFGHSSIPKYSEPNSVIDHIGKDGSVDSRGFYDSKGLKLKDIHTNNHGNPKHHSFGNHGEHAHDYEWNEDGSLKNKSTRELNEQEVKDNTDIL